MRKSTAAVIITFLYLLAVATSFIIILITADDIPMSGIFLILVTLPWSFILTWIQDSLHLSSMGFNGLFLVTGGLLNSFILFKLISFIACKCNASHLTHQQNKFFQRKKT